MGQSRIVCYERRVPQGGGKWVGGAENVWTPSFFLLLLLFFFLLSSSYSTSFSSTHEHTNTHSFTCVNVVTHACRGGAVGREILVGGLKTKNYVAKDEEELR